jgi:hypothetical protein
MTSGGRESIVEEIMKFHPRQGKVKKAFSAKSAIPTHDALGNLARRRHTFPATSDAAKAQIFP